MSAGSNHAHSHEAVRAHLRMARATKSGSAVPIITTYNANPQTVIIKVIANQSLRICIAKVKIISIF